MENLNVEELGALLLEERFPAEIISSFKEQVIDGGVFLALTDEELKEAVPTLGLRVKMRKLRDNAVSKFKP